MLSVHSSSVLKLAIKLCLVFSVILLAACASRPDEGKTIRTILPIEAIDPSLPTDAPVQRGRDNNHTILALSAGGADGAFGAGVLAGWTASGTRPSFDVVTGVSTGALLSVLTFLGPQYDDLAKELYTTQTNDQIFKSRGLNGIFSDSLYDNTPLKDQIEKYITVDLLAKVAAEHQKGRRLYVATTNLDAGQLVIWDMGEIALGGRANPVQHFQKVLRASAAVPGFFQPVYIKPQRGVQLRQAHVDGGVKEPVLYADFMGRSAAEKKDLYIIINGSTRHFNDSIPVKPNLASIAQKTIVELMRELQSDTVFRHYSRAKNSGIRFHVTAIPDEIPISEKSLDFNPARMKTLYDAGFKIGNAGTEKWKVKPQSVLRETRQFASSQ
jgi:predicted acylesterase/phospholipase RssA